MQDSSGLTPYQKMRGYCPSKHWRRWREQSAQNNWYKGWHLDRLAIRCSFVCTLMQTYAALCAVTLLARQIYRCGCASGCESSSTFLHLVLLLDLVHHYWGRKGRGGKVEGSWPVACLDDLPDQVVSLRIVACLLRIVLYFHRMYFPGRWKDRGPDVIASRSSMIVM